MSVICRQGQANKTLVSCIYANRKAEFSEKCSNSFGFNDLKILFLHVGERLNCLEKATSSEKKNAHIDADRCSPCAEIIYPNCSHTFGENILVSLTNYHSTLGL